MSNIIVLSRELPLPPLFIDDEEVEVRVFSGDLQAFENAKVFVCTSLDSIHDGIIRALPKSIGLIANIGVGVDHIDLDAANSRGIIVSNTPVVTEDTADLAFTLILSASRALSANERFLRAGLWSSNNLIAVMGSRIHGKSLGIVGFGQIGQALARRAKGFNMSIFYFSRTRNRKAEAHLNAHYCNSLTELLSKVDIVSLHCPLDASTRHIINAASLKACKSGAIIINTGRGGLIDDEALLNALEDGSISAAGLDVFEDEPYVNEAYFNFDRVVLSPHIGSATRECRRDMLEQGLANVFAYLSQQPVINAIGGA